LERSYQGYFAYRGQRNRCRISKPLQCFIYLPDGPRTTFLGRGDLHDHRFNALEQSSVLTALDSFTVKAGQYTGVPLDDEFCPTTIRIYPSIVLYDIHHSTNPATFTAIMVSIFAFTSAVFVMYDCCVERRQQVVMHTVVTSAANVCLLEEKVRERTTKLQETNDRLEEAHRQVVQASAAQLQHFACMSHEIRTPLNCIIGCSSLLKDTDLDPMQEESIQMITSSGDLLLAVVDDVLDYSRLESGNVQIEIKNTSLQEALDSVVRSMATRAHANDISLRTFYDVALPERFYTDARRLQQIMYNLLGNALKFGRGGGFVELHIYVCARSPLVEESDAYFAPLEKTKLEPWAIEVKDAVLRFVVKDYGKGIARQDFQKIFKPFLQDNNDTGCLYGGSGLGLAITTRLVHRMGGCISVESQVGEWSKFTVDLPYSAEASAATDLDGILSRLRDSSLCLVSNMEEVSPNISSLCRNCDIPVACARSMEELLSQAPSVQSKRPCVFLVQEDLYERKTFELLASSTSSKPVLLTFGPKSNVKEANDHYRSLLQLLPRVLMKSMSAQVADVMEQQRTNESSAKASLTDEGGVVGVPYSDLRILIAEDNVVNQKVLNRILKRLGAEKVTIVENGKLAVDREANEIFDIVLMDMQMPVMDGIEACRIIHDRVHSDGLPRPKVIFVTAHALNTYEDKCYEAGADDFLSKPCSLSTVDLCFQRAFEKGALRQNREQITHSLE